MRGAVCCAVDVVGEAVWSFGRIVRRYIGARVDCAGDQGRGTICAGRLGGGQGANGGGVVDKGGNSLNIQGADDRGIDVAYHRRDVGCSCPCDKHSAGHCEWWFLFG